VKTFEDRDELRVKGRFGSPSEMGCAEMDLSEVWRIVKDVRVAGGLFELGIVSSNC